MTLLSAHATIAQAKEWARLYRNDAFYAYPRGGTDSKERLFAAKALEAFAQQLQDQAQQVKVA